VPEVLPIPIPEEDRLGCPYCGKEHTVVLSRDPKVVSEFVTTAKLLFKVREANYHLVEWCKKCFTIWFCEKVDSAANDGKPFAWDTYHPSTADLKKPAYRVLYSMDGKHFFGPR
jgi:hypothetical protein